MGTPIKNIIFVINIIEPLYEQNTKNYYFAKALWILLKLKMYGWVT
jgi:hypothetical protein